MAWNKSSLTDKIQSCDEYQCLYELSIEDPNRFWKIAAERLLGFVFQSKLKIRNSIIEQNMERILNGMKMD